MSGFLFCVCLQLELNIQSTYRMLKRGSEAAREAAAATLADVRRAMRIDYFDDEALIAQQAQEYR